MFIFTEILSKCSDKPSLDLIDLIEQPQDYNWCALRPMLPTLLSTSMIGTAMWRTWLCAFLLSQTSRKSVLVGVGGGLNTTWSETLSGLTQEGN